MMNEDIPAPRDQCPRYCPKHPMYRCGGVFHHRGYHQCAKCELDGIKKGWIVKTPLYHEKRFFEYE